MSSLINEGTKGSNRWRLQFRVDGKQRQLRLGSIRESAAHAIQRNVDELLTSHRLKMKPDGRVQEWLMRVDRRLLKRLENVGITDQVHDVIAHRYRLESAEENKSEATLGSLRDWYLQQRKPESAKQSNRNMSSVTQTFVDYCAQHGIVNVDDLTQEFAFNYQLHRRQAKAEATVSKDIKVLKTMFSYAVRAGQTSQNPFAELKPGSDLNLDRQQVISVEDTLKIIEASPNSTWRVLIALARFGGLRCPSELTNLMWSDVNWDSKTLRVESPKTKRHGKSERTIPIFAILHQELAKHHEEVGESAEYVIDNPSLRKTGASLATRFNAIAKNAGVGTIPRPFPNMRMSCANDMARIPGITTKNLTDWMGHDIKTALKHYQRTTQADFMKALVADPFAENGYTSGYILPANAREPKRLGSKTPGKTNVVEHARKKYPLKDSEKQ